VFMHRWVITMTQNNVNQMQKTVYDTAECDFTGINIDSVCQDTQTVYTNITNTKELEVTAIYIRTYNMYNQPDMYEKNLTIKPGRTMKLDIFKEGAIKKLEIIPIITKNKKTIICKGKSTSTENIEQCY